MITSSYCLKTWFYKLLNQRVYLAFSEDCTESCKNFLCHMIVYSHYKHAELTLWMDVFDLWSFHYTKQGALVTAPVTFVVNIQHFSGIGRYKEAVALRKQTVPLEVSPVQDIALTLNSLPHAWPLPWGQETVYSCFLHADTHTSHKMGRYIRHELILYLSNQSWLNIERAIDRGWKEQDTSYVSC